MRQRIDGIETRKRILEAASRVFADKGFREATVAEICERAQANIASVNYHFRDKESLYVEVWKHAAALANELYPIDGGVPADAPAEQRFRGHQHALLKRVTDQGRLGDFHRLRTMEMANPTGIIDQVRKQTLKPLRQFLLELLRELLGPEATETEVQLGEMSVIGPCLMAGLGVGHKLTSGIPTLTPQQVETYADHFVEFSLAGIQSMRQRIEANGKKRVSG